jgi:hypothetical protein
VGVELTEARSLAHVGLGHLRRDRFSLLPVHPLPPGQDHFIGRFAPGVRPYTAMVGRSLGPKRANPHGGRANVGRRRFVASRSWLLRRSREVLEDEDVHSSFRRPRQSPLFWWGLSLNSWPRGQTAAIGADPLRDRRRAHYSVARPAAREGPRLGRALRPCSVADRGEELGRRERGRRVGRAMATSQRGTSAGRATTL